jgi:hypothetical protein
VIGTPFLCAFSFASSAVNNKIHAKPLFGCSYARCVAKVFDLSALISQISVISGKVLMFLRVLGSARRMPKPVPLSRIHRFGGKNRYSGGASSNGHFD